MKVKISHGNPGEIDEDLEGCHLLADSLQLNYSHLQIFPTHGAISLLSLLNLFQVCSNEFKSKLKSHFLEKLSSSFTCMRLTCPHSHLLGQVAHTVVRQNIFYLYLYMASHSLWYLSSPPPSPPVENVCSPPMSTQLTPRPAPAPARPLTVCAAAHTEKINNLCPPTIMGTCVL